MKTKFTLLICAAFMLMRFTSIAQTNTFPTTGSAGIGTTAPNASSLLEMKSTTQGLLIPRMKQAQRDAIVSPATGLLIYQTDNTIGFYFYNGANWTYIASKAADKNLDNLISPTLIGVDLTPATTNTVSLGSSSIRYKDVNLYNLKFADGTVQTTAATGSASQWTTNGASIYNNNSGNVGIGITSPVLAGLIVNKKSGAVNAMFGSDTTGIAIESGFPGIGLNSYYNNGRKFIHSGYGALISLNPVSGLLGFYNSAATGTANGAATLNANMVITAAGLVGINNTNPALAGLMVDKPIGNTYAMFGSNSTGVSLEASYPGISFNGYYNGGRKSIAAGYVGGISMNASTGTIILYNSSAATTSAGATTSTTDRVTIDKNGTMTVPGSISTSSLTVQASNNYSVIAVNESSNPTIYATNSGTGAAASFSSESGPALTTSIGNVGIGNTNPTLGGLVVDSKEGAVNAMFGSDTTGVAIETAYPGIGLNTYYNNGRKFIHKGFGAVIGLDPTSGLIGFYNSASSGNAGATATTPAAMVITAVGNIGMGTTTPAYKLDVCGTIRAKEVLVQTGWCDYVFNKDYKLRSLNEVESYINQNKHLPDVPSATEVEDKGVKVAQMDSILIKKVEELTLYVIDQNKQIQQLQQKVIQLENKDADKKN